MPFPETLSGPVHMYSLSLLFCHGPQILAPIETDSGLELSFCNVAEYKIFFMIPSSSLEAAHS